MEWEHGGAANARTVQQAQRQALHEGQRRGLGGAVVDGAGDGRLRQDGVDADHVAVLQLQHAREEGLRSLGATTEEGGESVADGGTQDQRGKNKFYFCCRLSDSGIFYLFQTFDLKLTFYKKKEEMTSQKFQNCSSVEGAEAELYIVSLVQFTFTSISLPDIQRNENYVSHYHAIKIKTIKSHF